MRYVAIGLLGLIVSASAFAQAPATQPTEKIPDLSTMSVDGLRKLAENLYRTLAKARIELAASEGRASAAARELEIRNKRLAEEVAKSEQLQAEIKRLKALIEADPAARQRLNAADRVAEAISSGKLVVGMTVVEANQALRLDGRKVGDNEHGETWQWERTGSVPQLSGTRVWHKLVTTGTWIATVRDGKIVSFEHDGAD